jgi:hypothetical protein
MNKEERTFYYLHWNTGHKPIPHPGCFKVPATQYYVRYHPDFFCPQCKKFYEVVSSHDVDPGKLLAFIETYGMEVCFVRPDGKPYIHTRKWRRLRAEAANSMVLHPSTILIGFKEPERVTFPNGHWVEIIE